MIIILEGPDGAGKTSLIRSLKEAIGDAEVHHFGAPVPGEDQFLRYAAPILDAAGKNIIYDRSWYSEFVYGPVLRGHSILNTGHCEALEHLVKTLGGGFIIYLTGNIDVLWERCCSRGETYIKNIEQLTALVDEYEGVMRYLPTLPVVRMDTTGGK